jgi:hypothetical protein
MSLRGLPLFELQWRNRLLTVEATTIDEMALLLEEAAADLRRMQGYNSPRTGAWPTTMLDC